MRRYAIIAGFGTALAVSGVYACATVGPQTPEAPLVAPAPDAGASARAPEPEPVPEPAPEPWTPDAGADLPDIEGAGRLLALGDPAGAIERIESIGLHEPPRPPEEGEAEPDPGEETRELSDEEKKARKREARADELRRMRALAIVGRAYRLEGRPAEAVGALAWVAEQKRAKHAVPPEWLALELAAARLAWANDPALGREAADEQRKLAASRLGKTVKVSPNRVRAPMRVAWARAKASVVGEEGKARRQAAKKAVKALERVITDYPNYPGHGELRLLRAQALVRSGDLVNGPSALRRLAIERAGEPDAETAWQELQDLAQREDKVSARAFSPQEKLERADNARQLRRLETSRAILDEMVADEDLGEGWRNRARRMRAHTAYRARDYETCIEDLTPAWEEKHNHDVRRYLSRCLDRGAQAEEAVQLWSGVAEKKTRGAKAEALWHALELAFRGGQYSTAQEILDQYEEKFIGHAGDRRFYRAWLAHRLGEHKAAIEGFERLANVDGRRDMARYFLGKHLLDGDVAERARGVELLQGLWDAARAELVGRGVHGGAPIYYGLWARQRLIEERETLAPPPKLEPLADTDLHPPFAQLRERFDVLVDEFGEASPSLRRADALHRIGWVDEARRELRESADSFINGRTRLGGGDVRSSRTEAIEAGAGWKAEWSPPKPLPSKEGRSVLRDEEKRERLRVGLRELCQGLDEPNRVAKLTPSDVGHKPRWHLRAFREAVEREAFSRHIDPTHVWALMYTESRFRPYVVSHVGARGALQVMPWTGRQLEERLGMLEPGEFYDPDRLYDIEYNAKLAVAYVDELSKKFHGQFPMAYASYNGGPSNVGRWLEAKASAQDALKLGLDDFVEEISFRESYRYTRRVMEVQATYALMYEGELPKWRTEVDPVVEDNIAF